MTTRTPIIRTHDRDAVVKFLRYLLDGFESGQIASYTSAFEVTGIGRHAVATNDPSMVPFDLSDIEPSSGETTPTPPTGPMRGKR